MLILEILAGIYLISGFLYALYLLLFGQDAWYLFPINMLFGPINIVYLVIVTLRGKRL